MTHRTACLRLLFLVAILPILGRGADRWSQIRTGMSSVETARVLGEPLMRSVGKGFELWIYDRGAEVVFYGGVIAWTAPAGSKVPASANEAWAFFEAAPDQLVLPFPNQKALLPLTEPVLSKAASSTGFRFEPRF